jgi:hypothetical protein
MSLERIGKIALLLTASLAPACMNEVPAGATLDPAEPAAITQDCSAPFDTRFDTIVSPRSGSIVEIGLDETHVYFITLDALFRAPRDGGDAQKLFTRNLRSGSTLAALWVRANDLVVYQDAWNVFAVPKGAGRVTSLPMLERMRDGRFAARDGQLVAGWNTVVDSQGQPEREYWSLDVESMQVSQLGRVPAPAGDQRGALGEGRLFWVDDPAQRVPDTRLYSMPAAGGGAEEVPVLPRAERGLSLFGAGLGQVYVLHESQLSRVPIAGGEIEPLADVEAVDDTSVLQFAASPTGVLLGLHEPRPGGRVQRYWLERDASHAALVPCIGQEEGPAFALDGEWIYSAFGGAGIARRRVD